MNTEQIFRKLPSLHPQQKTASILERYHDWFYEYSFTNGASTVVSSDHVLQIHSSRGALIFPFLDDQYDGKWDSVSCCDIACNQGWFATQIALRDAKHVLGIDARAEHIEKAEVIKEISGIPNLSFRQQNLFSISPENAGKFTFTLFLGILYHLDSPMDALRIVRSITESLCVIETQVVPNSPTLECTWSCAAHKRSGPGIAVLPSQEEHVCGGNPLTFVPSIEALYTMLFAVGFTRIYRCIPPQTMHEQYSNSERVVLFAYVK